MRFLDILVKLADKARSILASMEHTELNGSQ